MSLMAEQESKMAQLARTMAAGIPARYEVEPLVDRIQQRIESSEREILQLKKLKDLLEKNEAIADAIDLMREVGIG